MLVGRLLMQLIPGGPHAISQKGTLMRMVWTLIHEGSQKRTLRARLKDPRAARGFRSTGQLEKAIGADRSTTERLLLAVGARKSDLAEEWTLNSALGRVTSALRVAD